MRIRHRLATSVLRACRPALAAATASVLASSPAVAADPGLSECLAQADDRQRLACYDRLFRPAAQTPPATAPSLPQPPQEGEPVSVTQEGFADEGLMQGSPMNRFWELQPADKRGTFLVRTYLQNFFLPLHYSSDLNRAPRSDTHGATPVRSNYRAVEAKLQVSLRTKAVEGLLLPGADLWLAYTQRSLWQLWNDQESSPFRSTDHEPEVIYIVPVPLSMSALPGGWQWRMWQLGFVHQSNGQSDPLSRSWNRLYVGTALERGEFGLQLRLNNRTREYGIDDNPGLTRYVGNTELVASWLPGRAIASLTWRTHPSNLGGGSLQLDWTYPVHRANPDGLRWYLQLFGGYGETLLDYNHRQNSIGAGVSLFNF